MDSFTTFIEERHDHDAYSILSGQFDNSIGTSARGFTEKGNPFGGFFFLVEKVLGYQ